MADESVPVPKMSVFPFRVTIDPSLPANAIRLVNGAGESVEVADVAHIHVPVGPPADICPVCDSPCVAADLQESPLGPACPSCVKMAADLRTQV